MTTWTPKPGDPCPPERYTQAGPHAFVDEDELARRREAWHAMKNAPPPDPGKSDAPEAATAGASEEEHESTEPSDPEHALLPAAYAHGPAPDQYAIDWAFDQYTGRPGPKLVLVALARHCFKPGDALAWPTAGTIGRLADMGRTAVLDNIKQLQALGLIQDTGARKGRTGRVIVWRLGKSPDSGLLNGSESGPFNHPDSAPLGGKWSGIRQEMVRIPDPEYPPKGGGGGAASAAAGAAAAAPRVDLPPGLDPALFAHWTDGWSEPEVQRLITHARVLAQDGHDLNALCRLAIAKRWRRWPIVETPRGGRAKSARPKRAPQPADDWSMPP